MPMTEIEWRFVVTRLPGLPDCPKRRIEQVYLSTGEPAVRVRIDNKGTTLTVKTRGEGNGPDRPHTRREFNYLIPEADGKELFESCPHHIAKMRYELPCGLELDIFENEHEGLVLAELEVEEGGNAPEPPPGWEWINVTTKREYTNQSLATNGLPEGFPPCRVD